MSESKRSLTPIFRKVMRDGTEVPYTVEVLKDDKKVDPISFVSRAADMVFENWKETVSDPDNGELAMVGYVLLETLAKNGSVSRIGELLSSPEEFTMITNFALMGYTLGKIVEGNGGTVEFRTRPDHPNDDKWVRTTKPDAN